MSFFNLSNLPLLPLEKIMAKVSSRDFIYLSAMAIYPITRKIKGFELKMHLDDAHIKMDDFYHSWQPNDSVSETIFKYQQLLKTFKGPLDTLQIQAELVGQLKSSAAIPSSCRSVVLTCKGGDGHQEAVDSLLAGMRMESLYFKVDGCELKHDHIFSLDRLYIDSAAWMKPNDLLKCDNKYLQIGSHELTEEAVNAFILKWLNGNNNRMEFALFDGSDLPPWDMEIVLDGITARQFDGDVRDSFYIPKGVVPQFINNGSDGQISIDCVFWGVDMSDAVDIRRAEGTWASLLVDEDSNQLRFVVWNEVRPTTMVIDKLVEEIDGLSDSHKRKFHYLLNMDVSGTEEQAINEDMEKLRKRISEKKERIITLSNQLWYF